MVRNVAAVKGAHDRDGFDGGVVRAGGRYLPPIANRWPSETASLPPFPNCTGGSRCSGWKIEVLAARGYHSVVVGPRCRERYPGFGYGGEPKPQIWTRIAAQGTRYSRDRVDSHPLMRIIQPANSAAADTAGSGRREASRNQRSQSSGGGWPVGSTYSSCSRRPDRSRLRRRR